VNENRQMNLLYNGAFRLVRKIATGGMATVYEAEQLGPAGFAKRIALKVIHPKFAREEEWLQLFIDEAKLSANLVHGNIVQIFQLGEVDGTYYIAMEYIQGPTLRGLMERHLELKQPIPHPIACYIASRVCRALDFAHNSIGPSAQRLDIVHRDVAPRNIMATWDGHIKLADFGIAKARTSVDPSTQGRLIGKKHYMSPEQSLGLHVDARSDVFSLGLVLYELLALQPMFSEEITGLALEDIAERPMPNVRDTIPAISEEVAHILTLALDREPKRRPTAAIMGQALDHWCETLPTLPTSDRMQEHLSAIYPNTFRPSKANMSAIGEETEFTNLRQGLRDQGRRFLAKLMGK